MTRNSKSASAAAVLLMQQRLQALGMSPEDFMARTGVTARELNAPTARIGRARYVRVLALAAAVPPALGLPRSVLQGVATQMPLLVGAWLNAPSMRAALESYLSYRPLLGEADRVVMRERDTVVRLEFLADDPQDLAAFQAKVNFNMLAEIVRYYDQGGATRFSAELTDPPRRKDTGFEAVLGGRCALDQTVNAVQFEAKDLDAPFPRYNPALARLLAPQVAAELAKLTSGSSLSLVVERAVNTMAMGAGLVGDPGALLSEVCSEVGMSRWTLQRKLAAEGTTFRGLWRSVRVQEARRLLLETSLSVAEVGDRLGFRSPNSFTRYFHDETGTSPLRFRRLAAGAGVLRPVSPR